MHITTTGFACDTQDRFQIGNCLSQEKLAGDDARIDISDSDYGNCFGF